jgi:hypothetical protein
MPKQSDDLSREGEPKQETEKGLTIPVPKKGVFDRLLGKAAEKRPEERPSQSEK